MTDKLLDEARQRQAENPDYDEADEDVETIIDETDGGDADERTQEN